MRDLHRPNNYVNSNDPQTEDTIAQSIVNETECLITAFLLANGPPPDRKRWIVVGGKLPNGTLGLYLASRAAVRASLEAYTPQDADDAAFIANSRKQLDEAPPDAVVIMAIGPAQWGSVRWVQVAPLLAREWTTKPKGWAPVPRRYQIGVNAEVNSQGGRS